jgi:hypothetical protein
LGKKQKKRKKTNDPKPDRRASLERLRQSDDVALRQKRLFGVSSDRLEQIKRRPLISGTIATTFSKQSLGIIRPDEDAVNRFVGLCPFISCFEN